MQKFFICTDGVAKGPYQLEELVKRGINENDLIWRMDLGISRYASEMEEFRSYFRKDSRATYTKTTASAKPDSLIKNVVLFSLLFALAGLIVYYFTTY